MMELLLSKFVIRMLHGLKINLLRVVLGLVKPRKYDQNYIEPHPSWE